MSNSRTASLVTNYAIPFKKRRHRDATIIWVARSSKHKPSWSFSNSSLIHTELRSGFKKKKISVKLRNYWDTTRNNERKSKYPNSSISISLTYPSLKKHHAWIVHEFALFKRSNMFLPSKNITTKNTIPIFWLIFIGTSPLTSAFSFTEP